MPWMICLACATNNLALCIMPTPSRDGRLMYVICRRCEGRRVLPRETWEREERRRSCRCLPHNATWTNGAIAQLLHRA